MNWYEIKALSEDEAEIFIYDQIGEDWFGTGVTAKQFSEELASLKASHIALHLNSPGGSVFDGQAIYNALTRHPAKVTTYIDGLAASIASIIALAGDTVVMAENALFMIHNAWGGVSGNAKEMRHYADILDKIDESLVSTYAAKTGKDVGVIIDAMDAETWYTAAEAAEFGFVDEVGAELKLAACHDLSRFKHPPVAIVGAVDVEPEPEPVADTPEPSKHYPRPII